MGQISKENHCIQDKYIPRTQMTLVLIWHRPSKIEAVCDTKRDLLVLKLWAEAVERLFT